MQFLNVIVIQRKIPTCNDNWLFLCDSKKLFLALAEEFEDSFSMEAIYYLDDNNQVTHTQNYQGMIRHNAKYFYLQALMNKGVSRVFLKFLFMKGKEECCKKNENRHFPCSLVRNVGDDSYRRRLKYHLNSDSIECKGCSFEMTGDYMKYNELTIDNCIIVESWSLDALYQKLVCLLPANIELTKEIERIKIDYGNNFSNRESALECFQHTITTRNISKQMQILESDIERWTNLTVHQKVDANFGHEYITILKQKGEIIKKIRLDQAYSELEKIDFDLTNEHEYKKSLLDKLNEINQNNSHDVRNLYQSFLSYENCLNELVKNFPEELNCLGISQYIKYFRLGQVMILNRMNQLFKSSPQNKQVTKEELDDAMMYFYETTSPQEAYEIQKETKYLKNREMGEYGEKEVDYALKWLDQSYILVPKLPDKKRRINSIKLYNPDFINEAQEYDHIVIGKQGVFCIETKTYTGIIKIDVDGNWIRSKDGQAWIGEKNPIMQVDRHKKLLQSFLRDIPVVGLICIANSKVIIEGIENSLIPLIKFDLLVRKIENWPLPDKPLSEKEIQDCLQLIESHRV